MADVPMKSMVRRPSLYRPTGMPKKVRPKGGGTAEKRAESAPVSELESPKLKIAGKSHEGSERALAESCSTSTEHINTNLVVAVVVQR